MAISRNELRKVINDLCIGDNIYINSVGLTVNAITYLRLLIKQGILIPDIEELKKGVKHEYLAKFIDGTSIFPQMSYYKIKN